MFVYSKLGLCGYGIKSSIAVAGEFELMFTNTKVHKIIHILKTKQGHPTKSVKYS